MHLYFKILLNFVLVYFENSFYVELSQKAELDPMAMAGNNIRSNDKVEKGESFPYDLKKKQQQSQDFI